MKIKKLRLDMDGVLADWLLAALAAHGLDPDDISSRWDAMTPRPWDLAEVIGCTIDEMWAPIDAAGESFWADMKPYEWCHELYAACCEVAPTTLLTSASWHPSSHSGKSMWIQRHFGSNFRDYIITAAPKSEDARRGVVLIDDSPRNCHEYREAGGAAILFPSFGNHLCCVPREGRLDYVKMMLDQVSFALEQGTL